MDAVYQKELFGNEDKFKNLLRTKSLYLEPTLMKIGQKNMTSDRIHTIRERIKAPNKIRQNNFKSIKSFNILPNIKGYDDY